jgi:hypothetical protein
MAELVGTGFWEESVDEITDTKRVIGTSDEAKVTK